MKFLKLIVHLRANLDLVSKGGANGTGLDVRESDGGTSALGLDIGGDSTVCGAASASDSRRRWVGADRVDTVEPKHLSCVVIPDTWKRRKNQEGK